MDAREFDLAAALGAEAQVSVQKITIYLPNKDKENAPLENLEVYIQVGMEILSRINSGVTRMPVAQGMWIGDGDKEVYEDTTVIFSYIRDVDAFINGIHEVSEFLHRFGQDTNQGEVMVEFSGEEIDSGFFERAYFIRNYQVHSA